MDLGSAPILEAPSGLESVQCAAALVHAGEVRFLMKGSLHSDELIKGIASRKAGLLTPRRISHVFVMDVPTHDRLLLIADAAINVAPNLRVKRDIVQNAIDLAHALGIAEPRVAVLSAIEDVNPAVPSTVDAAALRDMAQRGEIVGGIVDGPLAFDNAISATAARVKGIASPVSGAVDIVIVPGIEAGNILYKSLVYLNDALAAGVVMGARVPVVLTSRADSMGSRVASAAVACLLAHDRTSAKPDATASRR
jgi:phosphotransacetylase